MPEFGVRRLTTAQPDFDAALNALTHWDVSDDDAVTRAAAAIVEAVRQRGDAALLEYTQRFDGFACTSVADLEIDRAELVRSADALPASERDALEQAAQRIDISPGAALRRLRDHGYARQSAGNWVTAIDASVSMPGARLRIHRRCR
jgi:histidinol dehydrogenase